MSVWARRSGSFCKIASNADESISISAAVRSRGNP